MGILVEQADGTGPGKCHSYLKKSRNKKNRITNKKNCKKLQEGIPEEEIEVVVYNRYQGYET
jgi:hypothetical protein